MQNAESEMAALQDSMFQAVSDNERFNANERFIEKLENCLEMQNSFRYDFALLDRISILTSKDKRFKIFTWAIVSSEEIGRAHV